VTEKEIHPDMANTKDPGPSSLGDEILKMLNERTQNPGEAFVLLQQLGIFIWDQYQIDWKDKEGQKVSETRKQRYMDFVSDLIDTLQSNNILSQKCD
jgi:hypothetical protein